MRSVDSPRVVVPIADYAGFVGLSRGPAVGDDGIAPRGGDIDEATAATGTDYVTMTGVDADSVDAVDAATEPVPSWDADIIAEDAAGESVDGHPDATTSEVVGDAAGGDTSRPAKPDRWSRPSLLRLAVVMAVGVLCAGLGAGAMRLMQPAAASGSAEPITVTVAVQQGPLTESVTARANITYRNSTAIDLSTLSSEVITDVAVKQGDTVAEGARLVDIAERPVIVLAGPIPMYRDLQLGDHGKDVAQLNAALKRQGYEAPGGDQYTANTAKALVSLYGRLGYASPSPPSDRQAAVQNAQQSLDDANTALAQAKAATSSSDVLQARLAVAQAQQAAAADPSSAVAKLTLQAAQQQLADARHPPAVASAQAEVSSAQKALAAAKARCVAQAPRAEIVFAASLPARVTSAVPSLGQHTDGLVVQLGAGALQASIGLSPAQHGRVKVGQAVQFTSDDGVTTATGVVKSVASAAQVDTDGNSSYPVVASLEGDDTALANQNAVANITIAATAADVLHVPVAAIITDPSGATFVDWCPQQFSSDGMQRLEVTVGMVANGQAEIRSPSIHSGDLVVMYGPGQ